MMMMMTPSRQAHGLPRLLIAYSAALAFNSVAAFLLMQLWARLTDTGFPLFVLAIIVPMLSALLAANIHLRQTGTGASLQFSLLFALLATLIQLVMPVLLLKMGRLDGLLYALDPAGIEIGMTWRAVTRLLMMIGGLGMLSNLAVFMATTRGEASRRARRRS